MQVTSLNTFVFSEILLYLFSPIVGLLNYCRIRLSPLFNFQYPKWSLCLSQGNSLALGMPPNFDLFLSTAAGIQELKVQPCSLNSVMIAYIIWFSPGNDSKKIKMLPSAELRYGALLKYVPDLFCWCVTWRLIAPLSVILPSGTAKAGLLHVFQVVWCPSFSFPLPFNPSKTPSPEGNATSLWLHLSLLTEVQPAQVISAGRTHTPAFSQGMSSTYRNVLLLPKGRWDLPASQLLLLGQLQRA